MDAGQPRRLDHLLGRHFLAEAGDVFGDRSVEQLDGLRQMADRIGQRLRRVL